MFTALNRHSWAEIAAMDRSSLAYVLPVSSLEQHGRHLPVGTDDLILQTSLDALEKTLQVCNTFLRLPALHYGNSFEHLNFSGTVTLRTSTMMAFVEDILSCMQKHGVRYLVVINSHGGNAPIFQAQAQEWAQRFGVEMFQVSYFGSDFFNDAQPLLHTSVAQDVHGGEIETSYLEYALPEVVRKQFAVPENDVLVDLADYDYAWLSRDLSPDNGLIGGASRGNEDTGRQIFAYVQQKLTDYFYRFDDRIDQLKEFAAQTK